MVTPFLQFYPPSKARMDFLDYLSLLDPRTASRHQRVDCCKFDMKLAVVAQIT